MSSEPQDTAKRTERFTVTPEQYVRFAWAGLIALSVIVATGAAVRLSGSGLGCPTWPKCYGNLYPPLRSHAVIEFGNRVLSVPLVLATGLAWVAALRRRPRRRDLVWISSLLPLGVVAQAVLGGFTVKGALDYGWVMAHFCLSMLILVAAVVLLWRSKHEAGWQPLRRVDRTMVLLGRVLAGMATITIVAGTAATAAGPHAGGSPGQKINRMSFDGTGTMDFVIHRHAEIAFVFSLLALLTWWLGRRRSAPRALMRPLTAAVDHARAAGNRRARPVLPQTADGAGLDPRVHRDSGLGDDDVVPLRHRDACPAGGAGPRRTQRERPRAPGRRGPKSAFWGFSCPQ